MGASTEALASDRAELLRICSELDDDGWNSASGCAGWSFKDVVAHMGALFWVAVDPSVLPDTTGLGTEAAQEVIVGSRRSLSGPEVLDDYAAVSEKALAVLDGFEGVDAEIPLGDLGTYPAHLLPSAYCFDHYTHIRADLFSPRGPLPGPAPSSDELRVGPALDWIGAALSQQNRRLLESSPSVGANIVITGTGARTIAIGDPSGAASATVRSDADTCVRWITQRASWDDLEVQAEGDPEALSVIRQLKVF
jgi:uncharacterized protein (TIGR03083 family)